MEISDCNILIVDDVEANLDLIVNTLGKNYNVSVALDGPTAIEYIEESLPDLILLDIMMPIMNGYEVCEKLKANKETKDIPIIFLTAMSKEPDEAKGLALGAVDYITKPFSPEIVEARVKNHLLLKLQHDALAKQNDILIENARLTEDIEAITHHDLKAPLNGILAFPNFVLNNADLNDKNRNFLEKTIKLGKKMLNMINISLDLYKMEHGTYEIKSTLIDIIPIIQSIIEENEIKITSKKLNVKILVDEEKFQIAGEDLLFYSMLSNLFKNAVEASEKTEQITFRLWQKNGIWIEIHNPQPVPENIRDTFFDKYITADKHGGTGLGTYSARLIVETLGGSIKMEASQNTGTTISMVFDE